MAEKRNFLLGRGESLTTAIPPTGRILVKEPPYTLAKAKQRLQPMLRRAVQEFDRLPAIACPSDQAVGALMLNPEYTAKSYFPDSLIRAFDLRTVGSHPTRVTPEQRSKGRQPEEKPTVQLFVAGTRSNFRRLLNELPTIAGGPLAQDLPAVEQFAKVSVQNKVKPITSRDADVPFEVVLHAPETAGRNFILEGFRDYLASIGLSADLDHRFHAGGLCFISMRAPPAAAQQVAEFSFLRVLRQMPRLRLLDPVVRGLPATVGKVVLPVEPALDPQIRVAVFDGGLPDNSPVSPWANHHEPAGIGAAVPEYAQHGLQVTSALLFGHLLPGTTAPRPYANIDHYRVLDDNSANDNELYQVLGRIRAILETSPRYDFINLSVGPELPIEDDEVHAWTAVLDEHLAEGHAVTTIAVGNTGHLDAASGLNRIQVPGDCVNALAVGACDRNGDAWGRADYSSVGPGRSPGLVKPDLVAFGGSQDQPYHTLSPGGPDLMPVCGTSFAAPHTLRSGVAGRAHFGPTLGSLAVRALLVHATSTGNAEQHEIGWGRVPDHLDELVECAPGVVRVVYQGELTASKYLRAPIPLPDGELLGKIRVAATCCFATDVDTAHPANYTRSGIEIQFRPHDQVFSNEQALYPKSRPFFSRARLFATEDELRFDAHKWETCLHGADRLLAKSLSKPSFDIHYLARDEGRADREVRKIRYALIVTIEAKRHKDLYDRVVRTYRNYLEPMVPIIEVPVRANVPPK